MKLEKHNIYIFECINHDGNPFKGKVEEVTEKTIQVTNLDTSITFRKTIKEFSKMYKATELIKNYKEYLKKVMKEWLESKPKHSFQDFTTCCSNLGCNRSYCNGNCRETNPYEFDFSHDGRIAMTITYPYILHRDDK